MKKIFTFLYILSFCFLLFSCDKKQEKEELFSKSLDYEIISNFNFKDKIMIKNNSFWLSKDIISNDGNFIFKEDEMEFFKYLEKEENAIRAIFTLKGIVSEIDTKNGYKAIFKPYFDHKKHNYSLIIEKKHININKNNGVCLPVKYGLKYVVNYKTKQNETGKHFINIPFNFIEDYKTYPYSVSLKNGDEIKYDLISNKEENIKEETIVIIPGILEPSCKYLSLAKNIFYKHNKKVEVIILNLPGIYGSTNKKSYYKMQDLKNWLKEVLNIFSLKKVSIIGIHEGSMLTQAFISDISNMKDYIFTNITFINPLSPQGLELYKKDMTPYLNVNELLEDKKIKMIDQAIKTKNYKKMLDIFKDDKYIKKLDNTEKIKYIKILSKQKSYLELTYAFLNFNLFGYYSDNKYENIQNSKIYNYTYAKTIGHPFFHNIGNTITGIVERELYDAFNSFDKNYIKNYGNKNYDENFLKCDFLTSYTDLVKYDFKNKKIDYLITDYKKEFMQPDILYIYEKNFFKNNIKAFHKQMSANINAISFIDDITQIDDIARVSGYILDNKKEQSIQPQIIISPYQIIEYIIDYIFSKTEKNNFVNHKWNTKLKSNNTINLIYQNKEPMLDNELFYFNSSLKIFLNFNNNSSMNLKEHIQYNIIKVKDEEDSEIYKKRNEFYQKIIDNNYIFKNEKNIIEYFIEINY